MYPPGQPDPRHYGGYPEPAPPGPYAHQGGYNPPPMGHHPPAAGAYPAMYHGPHTAELASYGQRVGAYLIDQVIVLVLALATAGVMLLSAFGLWELVDPPAGGHDPPGGFIVMIILTYPLTFAVALSYRWLTHGKSGKTLGKRAVGIRLVSESTGASVGLGPSAGRELVMLALNIVSCGVGNLLDLLWPLWDEKRQTLHDKAISSRVIRTR